MAAEGGEDGLSVLLGAPAIVGLSYLFGRPDLVGNGMWNADAFTSRTLFAARVILIVGGCTWARFTAMPE